MSRKIAYSLTQVFENAIPIFLNKGFRGCSMETLINYTNFNRRAFYLEFGNKQNFSHALIDHYIEHHLIPLQANLQVNQNIPRAIIQYFEAYQRHINKQGCLLVKFILELSNEDKIIQNKARRYFDNLQLVFIGCLERAILHHELPQDIDIEAFALKLSSFAQGFAVSNSIRQGESDVLMVIRSLFAKNA